MAVSSGGDIEVAAGPTDLSRYLPVSLIATLIVAGIPLWIAFDLTRRLGLIATVISIAVSFALGHVGAMWWQRQPGSRDVVFNDLMLWGFIRRSLTQQRLTRRVEKLALANEYDPDLLTLEERTAMLKKLAVALETGDPYTHGHSERVARHAFMVAKTLKLSRREAEKIRLAGIIHDIGKLRIPRRIITKPGKLTGHEFERIKRHTVDGAAMVEALGDQELTDMVRYHHERLDGSGYPNRLIGDQISIGARVLAVADTFDAASSLRPYRPAQKHKVALDILRQEAEAGRLDKDVVDAFINYYSGRRGIRWWALLSAGQSQLHELPVLLQRAGAAGLANAAVVGMTAVTLAQGSPLGVFPKPTDSLASARVAVADKDGRASNPKLNEAADGSENPAASTIGKKQEPGKASAGGSKRRNGGNANSNGRSTLGGGNSLTGKGPKGEPGDTRSETAATNSAGDPGTPSSNTDKNKDVKDTGQAPVAAGSGEPAQPEARDSNGSAPTVDEVPTVDEAVEDAPVDLPGNSENANGGSGNANGGNGKDA